MLKKKVNFAIIDARLDAVLLGKPVIRYIIEEVQSSKADVVLVLTPKKRIKEIALESQTQVFIYDKILSYEELIKLGLSKINNIVKNIALIRGDCLMLSSRLIDLFFDELETKKRTTGVIAVQKLNHPQNNFVLDKDNYIKTPQYTKKIPISFENNYEFDGSLMVFRNKDQVKGPRQYPFLGRRCSCMVRSRLTKTIKERNSLMLSKVWLETGKKF